MAQARELAWITSADDKSDRSDAEKLARLARADVRLLKPVRHRRPDQQARLSIVRAREVIVRARAQMVNAARGMAKGFGARFPATITATFGLRALAMIPELLKPALQGLLAQIDDLTARIKSYDEQVEAMVTARPDLRPVCSIPGVGPLTALTFALTLGGQERFAHSRDVGAYVGLRPERGNWGQGKLGQTDHPLIQESENGARRDVHTFRESTGHQLTPFR